MNGKHLNPDVTNELVRERTRKAADRTLLAWIRTTLSLIGFGFTTNKVLTALEARKLIAQHTDLCTQFYRAWHVRSIGSYHPIHPGHEASSNTELHFFRLPKPHHSARQYWSLRINGCLR